MDFIDQDNHHWGLTSQIPAWILGVDPSPSIRSHVGHPSARGGARLVRGRDLGDSWVVGEG